MDGFSAQATVPSASGYPNYSRLSNPIFARSLVRRFQHEGVSSRFTTDNVEGQSLKDMGAEVLLRREPEAEIFDYQKNQTLSHSNLNTDVLRLIINRAKYWNLKLNDLDRATIPDVNRWVEAFKRNAAAKLDNHITREVLVQVPYEASPFNKGRCAGINTGAYDLGSMGNPVTLTPGNFGTYMAFLDAVLTEQDVPKGDRFIVLPPMAKTLFFHKDSPFYGANVSGLSKTSLLLTGEFWNNQLDFDFIFSNDMEMRIDPVTGDKTWVILAGRKDAVAMTTALNKTQIIENDAKSFDTYWRGLQVYGFKTIRPESLAVLYATFSVPTTEA